nr:pyrophosphatase [Tanacetum cinerariifolium]
MAEGGYAVIGIVNMRFLVKTWRRYTVSLFLDMTYCGLAAKIKDIDGKILGKTGNHRMVVRGVKFDDVVTNGADSIPSNAEFRPLKSILKNGNRNGVDAANTGGVLESQKGDGGSSKPKDSLMDNKDNSGSLLSGLAAKIKDIDGKILGKTGNHRMVVRGVKFDDVVTNGADSIPSNAEFRPLKSILKNGNRNGVDAANTGGVLESIDTCKNSSHMHDAGVNMGTSGINHSDRSDSKGYDDSGPALVAIPLPNGNGHTLERIAIEYEWQLPCCEACKIFDHMDNQCPEKVKDSAQRPMKDKAETKAPDNGAGLKKSTEVEGSVGASQGMGIKNKEKKTMVASSSNPIMSSVFDFGNPESDEDEVHEPDDTMANSISIFVSFIFAATCCVATDALGMLGTIATGVVIDAYGPICDNAGCTYDMAGMTVRIKQASMDGGVQILHQMSGFGCCSGLKWVFFVLEIGAEIGGFGCQNGPALRKKELGVAVLAG